ncbi:MAG TPA: hypothetical protein VNM40_00635 [Candidatus Paceibacterota bacterium]|nr:hypothetical protein [Candidatus Paceibacterota bacterium]
MDDPREIDVFVGRLQDEVTHADFNEIRSRATKEMSPAPVRGSHDEARSIFYFVRNHARTADIKLCPVEYARALKADRIRL